MRFSGDLRLRHESFLRSDSTPDGRFRLRFRFGMTVPVSSRVTGGARIATVEPGSVTSENITLTGETAPKTVQLTAVWARWEPWAGVAFTGGKFGIGQVRPPAGIGSELVFDDDLAPEGFHQNVTLVRSDTRWLRQLTLVGDQWSLRVVRDSADSWMVGGQVAAVVAPWSRARLGVALGYLAFLNGRALAQARNDNRRLLVTNAVILRDGTINPGGKAISPTAGNPFMRFQSRFKLVTGSVVLDLDRALGARPVSAYLDVVHNTGATEHRSGYSLGVRVGALQGPGQWVAAAAWHHAEREAVLSMFTSSDFGPGGTNVRGAILQVQYRPVAGVTLSARDHLVVPILLGDGLSNRWLHRVQLDAVVSF
jgi:hypothetical protein